MGIETNMIEHFPCWDAIQAKSSIFNFKIQAPFANEYLYIISSSPVKTKGHTMKFAVYNFEKEGLTSYYINKRLIWYSTVVWDGKIYILGGYLRAENAICSSVYYYNPQIRVLTLHSMKLKNERMISAAVVFKNHLYVAGGKTYNNNDLATVERWDFTTEWTSVKSMNHARSGFALIEIGGKLVAIGGYHYGTLRFVHQIEVYDDINDVWIDYDTMDHGRTNFAATVLGKRIYIAGGEGIEGVTYKSVASWSPETCKWRTEKSMGFPRKNFSLATLMNRQGTPHIYAIGGYYGVKWSNCGFQEKLLPFMDNTKWKSIM